MSAIVRRGCLCAGIGVCLALMLSFLGPNAFAGGKPIEIKLDEFAKEWKKDRKATTKKYTGKYVIFTGPILYFEAIGKEQRICLTIRCEPGREAAYITVFPKENAQPWATFGVGQVVTVKGKYGTSLDPGAVIQHVNDGTIETSAKNPTITLKSTELGAEATPDRDKAAARYLNKCAIVVGEVVKISERKDVVFLKGKDAVLIECHMHAVEGPQLGTPLTVGKEARIFGMIQEQLNPILDDSKNFRVRDCLVIAEAKKK